MSWRPHGERTSRAPFRARRRVRIRPLHIPPAPPPQRPTARSAAPLRRLPTPLRRGAQISHRSARLPPLFSFPFPSASCDEPAVPRGATRRPRAHLAPHQAGPRPDRGHRPDPRDGEPALSPSAVITYPPSAVGCRACNAFDFLDWEWPTAFRSNEQSIVQFMVRAVDHCTCPTHPAVILLPTRQQLCFPHRSTPLYPYRSATLLRHLSVATPTPNPVDLPLRQRRPRRLQSPCLFLPPPPPRSPLHLTTASTRRCKPSTKRWPCTPTKTPTFSPPPPSAARQTLRLPHMQRPERTHSEAPASSPHGARVQGYADGGAMSTAAAAHEAKSGPGQEEKGRRKGSRWGAANGGRKSETLGRGEGLHGPPRRADPPSNPFTAPTHPSTLP